MLHVVIGRQNAGKSTTSKAIAAAVTALHGRAVVTMEMSDALKDAASVMFGFDRDLLRNETDEARAYVQCPQPFWETALGRPGFSPRIALQEVGLAMRTTVGTGVWSSAVVRRATALLGGSCTDVVVSGVRYPDEVVALASVAATHRHRVVLYCVRRPSQPPLTADAPDCERFVEDAQRTALGLAADRVTAHVLENLEEPADNPGRRSIAAAVARLVVA